MSERPTSSRTEPGVREPDRRGERLGGCDPARPRERLAEQRQGGDRPQVEREHRAGEPRRLLERGPAHGGQEEVADLVVQVPRQDPVVRPVRRDHVLHVGPQPGFAAGVDGGLHPGRLQPPRVVDAGHGLGLRPGRGIGVPAVVEQHGHRADAAARGRGEEALEAPEEAGGVDGPGEVVEEHAHRVHAEPGGPRELPLDGREVERLRLPHLELVDRGARREVAPDDPGLPACPRRRSLGRPAPVTA